MKDIAEECGIIKIVLRLKVQNRLMMCFHMTDILLVKLLNI